VFENKFVKIKVVGVNTTENNSGGLTALNYLLEQNLSGVNYLAVDRNDVENLNYCNATNKFRLLTTSDENFFTKSLCGADLIFILADNVWENIKLTALTAHCAKKTGSPVIFIAGGDFEDAEDEIIFDALIKLPNKNFEHDSCKIIKNFIDVLTLPGQPKADIEKIADFVKNSGAIMG